MFGILGVCLCGDKERNLNRCSRDEEHLFEFHNKSDGDFVIALFYYAKLEKRYFCISAEFRQSVLRFCEVRF